MPDQIVKHFEAHAVRALNKFTSFLQWLTHSNIAEHFQQSAFRLRDPRRPATPLKGSDMPHGVWTFIEQAFAVILGWKTLGEPFRKVPGHPP